ncbi:hypothetical protein [Methanobrevibacter arboriphilus]|uniref:hypothetical protein n=1 Tax=Methanobrevibacter arboriphilus TaxID=39441 RepID=UPI001CDA9038|nr:hypothetical protein [Methanobrevibacter arboriphilus]
MILIAVLVLFTFNSIFNNNVDYMLMMLEGIVLIFLIFLKLESEDSTNISYGKIYSNDQINLAIIVRKDINLSKDELLDEYNVTNYKM